MSEETTKNGDVSAVENDTAAPAEAAQEEPASPTGQLEKEKAELYDQLLRRTAEFDNFRKRSERERAEFTEYASQEAVRALLPVLDDFERALKAETADAEYAKGMALIYQRLFDTLKKLGLSPIEAEGKTFDPEFHHAIEMVEDAEAEADTVITDLQRGYLFRNRLLRPSIVRVAKGS
jgi:molecular chaperone GrpE